MRPPSASATTMIGKPGPIGRAEQPHQLGGVDPGRGATEHCGVDGHDSHPGPAGDIRTLGTAGAVGAGLRKRKQPQLVQAAGADE